MRLCTRSHPCDRICSNACGQCQTLVPCTLDCGHENLVPWCVHLHCRSGVCACDLIRLFMTSWQVDNLETVRCSAPMEKSLLSCEHTAMMMCSTDPSQMVCRSQCKVTMSCCQKPCQAECGVCQQKNVGGEHRILGILSRRNHQRHPCNKPLYCQHLCNGDCSADHECSEVICLQRCRQKCLHHACKLPCSTPCALCMEPCDWKCDHHVCPVSCGAVSSFRFVPPPSYI